MYLVIMDHGWEGCSPNEFETRHEMCEYVVSRVKAQENIYGVYHIHEELSVSDIVEKHEQTADQLLRSAQEKLAAANLTDEEKAVLGL